MLLWEWKIWLKPQISLSVVFSSSGSVGQKLTGPLWASKNCCDCVISLLMKKPAGMFDLENAHTAFALQFHFHCVNDWMRNQTIKQFLPFSVYSHSMFAYLLWCFNNPFHVKCKMGKAAYSSCFTSSIIPVIPWGLTWVKWFVCFLSSCWREAVE